MYEALQKVDKGEGQQDTVDLIKALLAFAVRNGKMRREAREALLADQGRQLMREAAVLLNLPATAKPAKLLLHSKLRDARRRTPTTTVIALVLGFFAPDCVRRVMEEQANMEAM